MFCKNLSTWNAALLEWTVKQRGSAMFGIRFSRELPQMSGIKLSRAVAKAMPLFGIRFSRELAAADVWNQTKQHYGRLHYQWKQCPGGNLSSDITILQQAELDVNQSLSAPPPPPSLSLPPPPPPSSLTSPQSLSVAAGPVSVFFLASSFFFDVGSYHPLSRNCLEIMLHLSLSLSLSLSLERERVFQWFITLL